MHNYVFFNLICTCLVMRQVQGAVHGGTVCEAIVELLCDESIRNWLRLARAVVLLCVSLRFCTTMLFDMRSGRSGCCCVVVAIHVDVCMGLFMHSNMRR